MRTRAEKHLTLAQREEISHGISAGWFQCEIARQLGRSPSTISRDISRNGGMQRYRANIAEALACTERFTASYSFHKLAQDWSPEQISGWLRRTYPDDELLQVSHETIYKSLFVQSRGVLKKELQKHLQTKRPCRQFRWHNNRGARRGQIIDGISISERPPEIEDRTIPGHWQGDLIASSSNTHMATLVE